MHFQWNEELVKLIRDVALRAVWPNSLFSVNSCPKITHLFWLDFIKTYTIMHQKQSSQYLIGFSNEKSAGRRYRQCFLFGKSCRKMYLSYCLQFILCATKIRTLNAKIVEMLSLKPIPRTLTLYWV
jgi:hypothetical protein